MPKLRIGSVMLLLVWAGLTATGLSFAHASVGDVIDNPEMPTLRGARHHLLGAGKASVFIFFRSGQENSIDTLRQLARIEKEMAKRSIHWAAIVSSRDPRKKVLADVKAAGIEMPILVDVDDTLYGKLGVALHPVIGVVDKDHKLTAYQPFTRVNYYEVIRARIRRLLGDISEEELKKVLHPPKATYGGDHEKAMRRLHFAEKLLERGRHTIALNSIDKAISRDSKFVPAHVLRGKILLAQGKKAEARAAFVAALALDPENAEALAGKKDCN